MTFEKKSTFKKQNHRQLNPEALEERKEEIEATTEETVEKGEETGRETWLIFF